jgi:apolipoprotein N-acyltransferase
VLLWTAFFPLNQGWVAFVALVPFLSLVRAEGVGRWRRYTAAWVGGLAFGALAVNWVRVAHPMMALFAWPGLALWLSAWWPPALYLLRRLDRLGKPPLALTLPVVWVALEYIKAHWPTGYPFLRPIHCYQLSGFAWYFLGHTQHANLPLLQSADLGGAYLPGAAVAAINGAVYDWAVRVRWFRWFVHLPRGWVPPTYRAEMMSTAGALTLLVLLLGYGGYRLLHKPFEPGPRVALLQGNVSQSEKMIRGDQKQADAVVPLAQEYLPLARRVFRGTDRPPDLVVWPETCWEDNWPTVLPGVTADAPGYPNTAARAAAAQKLVADEVRAVAPTYALIGLNGNDWDGTRWRNANTAVLLRPDETDFFAGRYDKMHLVPFGEYVPFRETFTWMKNFTPYGDRDYSCTPGEAFTRFEVRTVRKDPKDPAARPAVRGYTFGVLICYEDSDPYLARQYHPWAGGQGVDFLVNISNDGWFDGTEQHEQHLAVCRFRAVETRRSVVRAVNMGISAVIDPDGRVLQMIDFEWADSKKKAGTIVADVPLDTRGSVYAAVGDWVPLLCWVGIASGLVTAWRAKRRAVRSSPRPPAA